MSFIKNRTIKITIVCVLAAALAAGGAFAIFDTAYGADEQTDELGYVDNQLIVTFKEDVTNKEAADIVAFAVSEEMVKGSASSTGGSIAGIKDKTTLKKIKSGENIMLVKYGGNIDEVTIAKEIARNPDVDSAQPNYRYKTAANSKDDEGTTSSGTTNSTTASETTASSTTAAQPQGQGSDWYLDYIDAPEAWQLIKEQKAKAATSTETEESTASESTETSTTEAAKSESKPITVATIGAGSEISLVKAVVGKDNDIVTQVNVDAASTTADLIAGIDYACNHNARIIMIAAGRQGYDGALERKVNKAYDEGVLVIAPAGDEGSDGTWYPSDFDKCIGCVNTVKYTDAYSTACKNEESNYGDDKNISAPGTDIKVVYEDGGEVTETGSVCSAAIVTGTAAMVMHVDPQMKAEKVKEVLENSANDISTSGRDVYTGHGNVNAQKAVAMAVGIKAKADKATLGKVTAKAKASDGNIAVSWSAVKDAKNYVIFKKGPDDKDYTQAVSVSKDETSWTDSSCVAGKEYSYKVMAASTSDDGKKIKGEMSDPVSAKAASKTTD